jgi:hypothetical protein
MDHMNSMGMKSVKSAGMIPCGPEDAFTIKNWNKVDFNLNVKMTDGIQDESKDFRQVKYHKGDFNTEMDHIQQL